MAHDLFQKAGSAKLGAMNVFTASSAGTILKNIPDAKKIATYSNETQSLFNSAKAAAEVAKTGSKEALVKAEGLFTKANAQLASETAKSSTGFFGKLKNVLGITKASTAINNLAVKSPKFAKCFNAFKAEGGPIMLAMEGGVELITNVIPTFKTLGAKKGVKQLGKSTVKTGASVGGWVAGAALGTKIGALIGSVIPGAGTAVGAVAGAIIGSACSLIGGSLLSRLAVKGTEKIIGKDELVIAEEQQAEQIAQQAQGNSEVLNQVVNGAAERLQNEGVSTEDSKVAYDSLNRTVASQQQAQAQQQSFKGTTNPFQSKTANEAMNDVMARPIQTSYMDKDIMAMQSGLI